MTWLYVLQALPEIYNLLVVLTQTMDKRGDVESFDKKKELKKNLNRISKALEENDEKAFNDVFNSL